MGTKVFFVLLLGLVFPLCMNAQHLFVYKNKTAKVVKVLEDKGNVYYYYEWNDTLQLSKAVFKDDLKEVTKVDSSAVDSVLLAMNHKTIADSVAVAVEQNKTRRNFFIPAVASSFRSDQFNYNLSVSYAIQYYGANLVGAGIGYERVNKGQSFILLNSIQLRMFYNRYFKGRSYTKRYYCGGEFTLGKTLSGKYNNAWTAENMRDELEMKDDYLGYPIGVKVLVGVNLRDRFLIDIGILSKNLGIVYPDDTKRYLLAELRVGYRL